MYSVYSRLESILRKNEMLLVVLFASILSATTILHFYNAKEILLYNDARGHLDIARRVIDGLTPGFMQIGSVWLPIYQIFELPFIWNNFLWHSGLAGSFISGISYVGACYFIYRIVEHLTKSKAAAIISLLVFALNPNLLYLQSVPLDEVLTVFMINASLFYILKWADTKNMSYLILSSLFVFLGTLVRYEAWFLLIFEVAYVFIISLKHEEHNKFKKAEGITVLFSTLAFLGLAIWLLYNYLGWNNPFYFLNSDFSAQSQQLAFLKKGVLLTRHNLLLSLWVCAESVVENIGLIVSTLSLISLTYLLLIKNKLQRKLFYAVSFSPIIFIFVSLFMGIIIIYTRSHPSPLTDKLFNIRYGILGLIPCSILIGNFYSEIRKRIKTNLLVFLIFASIAFLNGYQFFSNSLAVVIDDGINGISAAGTDNEAAFTSIIQKNCSQGLTLISAGSNDGKMFASQLPMKSFISEGSGKYWKEAISDPQKIARCVTITENESDSVYKTVYKNPKLLKNYSVIYENGGTIVYKLSDKLQPKPINKTVSTLMIFPY